MLPTYISFGLLTGDRTAVLQLRIFQGGMEKAALHRWPSPWQETHLACRICCALMNSAFGVHTVHLIWPRFVRFMAVNYS